MLITCADKRCSSAISASIVLSACWEEETLSASSIAGSSPSSSAKREGALVFCHCRVLQGRALPAQSTLLGQHKELSRAHGRPQGTGSPAGVEPSVLLHAVLHGQRARAVRALSSGASEKSRSLPLDHGTAGHGCSTILYSGSAVEPGAHCTLAGSLEKQGNPGSLWSCSWPHREHCWLRRVLTVILHTCTWQDHCGHCQQILTYSPCMG